MNTHQIELTQQEADALELAYPITEIVRKLIDRVDGVSAEEKAAILAMPCMCVDHLAGVA